jgi:hypothetical protein
MLVLLTVSLWVMFAAALLLLVVIHNWKSKHR